jgi:hypothetical protein
MIGSVVSYQIIKYFLIYVYKSITKIKHHITNINILIIQKNGYFI